MNTNSRFGRLGAENNRPHETTDFLKILKAAVNQALDGLAVTDPQGDIIFVNQSWARMHGYQQESLIGKHMSFFHTARQMREEITPYRKKVIASGAHEGEIGHLHADGTVFPTYMKTTCITNNKGEFWGLAAVAQDITNKKKFMTERERLIAIIESTSDLIATANEKREIDYINTSGRDMLGLKDMQSSIRVDDVHSRLFMKKLLTEVTETAKTKGFWEGEAELIALNGEKIPVSMVTMVQHNEKGDVVGYATIARDITVSKQREKQLRKREALLAKQKRSLEEANAAFRVLLNQRETDKKDMEKTILTNLNKSIIPNFEKLRKTLLNKNQKTLLNRIEIELRELISPFISRLCIAQVNLTPQEIRVAEMIRDGYTTKEISKSLCLSENTITTHRYHIRSKLGLKNKRSNLCSYLNTLK